MPESDEARRLARIANTRRWQEAHPDRVRLNNRAHNRRNPRRWERYQATRVERMRYWRAWVIIAAGGVCCVCSFGDPRALQLDHVAGGGNRERRDWRSVVSQHRVGTEAHARAVLERVRRGELQLLCANCNWIKRRERGEHGVTPPGAAAFSGL